MTGPSTRSTVRPTKPRPRLSVVLGIVAAFVFTIFSARQVNMRLSTFVDMWTNPLWEKFWPIEWGWVFDRTHVFNPLIETFQIGIISAVVGCTLALPISFAMSRLTTPNRVVYYLTKAVMNVVRAVPDLFWAKLLVTAVGIGAFAGSWALSIFSLAVMVKLFSEDVDGADPRPLEAAKAAGGRHLPSVATGIFPTVFPAYVAYSLYVLELNIRASLVLGLVGAGGIGRVIEAQRQVFQFDRILGILVIIFVVVFVLEQISVALRKRLV